MYDFDLDRTSLRFEKCLENFRLAKNTCIYIVATKNEKAVFDFHACAHVGHIDEL